MPRIAKTNRVAISGRIAKSGRVSSTRVRPKLYLIMGYGQSLSTGYNGAPPLTTSVPVGVTNYKFIGGIDSPSDTSSLVPLISGSETIPTIIGATSVETPWVNCANILAQNYGKNFLAVNAGVPSTPASSRVPGTAIFIAMMSLVTAANTRARALGYDLIVCALTDVSGESDFYAGSAYYSNQLLIQAAFETQCKAITGQSENIPMFMSCCSSFTDGLYDVNVAMRDLVVNFPNKFSLIGPKYLYSYADTLHLDNNGYKNLGAAYAKAIGKQFFETTNFSGTYPTGAVRAGNLVTITYHVPVGVLQSDIVTVTDPTAGNLGFEWYDDSSSVTVASVSIINATQITVTLSGIPSGANKYVGYARTNPGGNPGPTTGARGNIKDGDSNWSERFLIPAT